MWPKSVVHLSLNISKVDQNFLVLSDGIFTNYLYVFNLLSYLVTKTFMCLFKFWEPIQRLELKTGISVLSPHLHLVYTVQL